MERVVFEVGSCGEAQAPAVVGEVELVDGVMSKHTQYDSLLLGTFG